MKSKVIVELMPMGENEAAPHLRESEEALRKYNGFIKGQVQRKAEMNTSFYIAEFEGLPDGIFDIKKPQYKQIAVIPI
jgi:hypothetical protein